MLFFLYIRSIVDKKPLISEWKAVKITKGLIYSVKSLYVILYFIYIEEKPLIYIYEDHWEAFTLPILD